MSVKGLTVTPVSDTRRMTMNGVVEVPASDPPQWMHWVTVTLPVSELPPNRSTLFDGDDQWVEFEPVGPDVWTVSSYSVTGSSLLAPTDMRRMQSRLDDALIGPSSGLAVPACVGCGTPADPRTLVNGVCADCERSYGPRDLD